MVHRLLSAAHRSLLAPRYRCDHLHEPDYSRPLLQVSDEARARMLDKLSVMYGEERARACYPEIERLMKVYYAHKTPEMIESDRTFRAEDRFTERDVVLITYGDLVVDRTRRPLRALMEFAAVYMRGAINTIHILPFFPYSSDRGFSIIDYEEVDPDLGTWDDIEELGRHFRLMFDGVFNHASSKSRWFQRFLNGRPGYDRFFVSFNTRDAIDPDYLRLILRPRTSDLLTPFQTIDGVRYVWTTFSADQIDLNFKYEMVLFRVVEILLAYVRHGADVIRLDAVTYIWRELGTSCAHLRQTHALVQLFRAILDVVAPHVALITETNVPHEDNISYFGQGTDESQLVYNFALPPLVLHAMHSGRADRLSGWASDLEPPSHQTGFFNFLASHDGIGLLGARGILPEAEIMMMVDRVRRHGGLVSYRSDGSGGQSPYELNVTWFSALNAEHAREPLDLQVDRYMAARAIALALKGVPGIYLPSLFGAVNDTRAIEAGAEARAINRRALDLDALAVELGQRESRAHQVATRFRRLIKRRIANPAFHPNAGQRVLDLGPHVFALERRSPATGDYVLALTNVTAEPRDVVVCPEPPGGPTGSWRELISRHRLAASDGELHLRLAPYGVLWLAPMHG
jgi:sucrose phosphorylase